MDHVENTPIEIPDKKHFKIGEAATIIGVKPYILRYWESEFKSLTPRKTSSRHRMYSRADIELLIQIKNLLYDQMYTIAGARKRLLDMQRSGALQGGSPEADEHMPEDPLEGTRLAALEQQVQMLQARGEASLRERNEALQTARMATDALKEVESAREEAQNEVEQLRSALGETEREYQRALNILQSSLDEALLEIQQLEAERDEFLTRPVASVESTLIEGDTPDEGNLVDIDALRRAHEATVAKAHRTEHDLRNKLRYQISHRQRILKELRAEVVSLADLAQAVGE